MTNAREQVRRLWAASPILTATVFLMFATFVVSVVGIFADPRIITGAPAWLKPAKFGISTAIYAATLAWLYRYIQVWRGYLRFAGWAVSIVFIIEIVIIDLQAARGVTSHFNNATPLDATLFGIMGASIGVLWLASVGIMLALFKQKFEDAAWGWALKLGMAITILGSAAGGLMISPTAAQMQAMREHQPVKAIGAHTVGAPDGGPGIPGVGWSTEHGDLRAPHFLGMHGIQIIPLFAWLFARRRVSMVVAASASYLALLVILTWQALRGESLIQPDSGVLSSMVLWVIGAGVALMLAGRRNSKDPVAPGRTA
jgi:hypothetical protein